MRELGIPTVADRLIQQALLQILQPIFEPEFSESSYGFRPGRNARQAVLRAQRHVRAGKRRVVDLEPERFFDRVSDDILMSRLARKVKDERVLKLIRRFLEAGLMREGLVQPRTEGTPQGGPLSPLLSNILPDRWAGVVSTRKRSAGEHIHAGHCARSASQRANSSAGSGLPNR